MLADCMTRLVAVMVLAGIACLVVTPFAGVLAAPLRAWRESRRALQTIATRARSLLILISLPLLPAEQHVTGGCACLEVNVFLCTWQC